MTLPIDTATAVIQSLLVNSCFLPQDEPPHQQLVHIIQCHKVEQFFLHFYSIKQFQDYKIKHLLHIQMCLS